MKLLDGRRDSDGKVENEDVLDDPFGKRHTDTFLSPSAPARRLDSAAQCFPLVASVRVQTPNTLRRYLLSVYVGSFPSHGFFCKPHNLPDLERVKFPQFAV